ncbi:MFS transporter [Cognatishimia sp. MH4019]|uniref:MFS transporter n=1 Tax=Cognatishimia sp. MH4019 TaxID=2854030 RepID=UPI001CD7C803|nr:MFS transporter [Cognatishimia sp. MH4019]
MVLQRAYATLTSTKSDDLEDGEARNGLVHSTSLILTKTADGLIDPKLVLSWLLNALGAPGAAIGALVPVREAGALLPQLALARYVERSPQRKTFWATGSALQGLAAAGIGIVALIYSGAVAGWTILALLGLLALARAASSVSYKDALARTIPKTRRGAVTGLASSAAAGAVLLFGGLLSFGLVPLETGTLAVAILIAAGFWLISSALFLTLNEPKSKPDASEEAGLTQLVKPLLSDAQLRRFIAARALLSVTALAPPFIVLLSSEQQRSGLGDLGPLVIASALASIVSGYVWGRIADRSSRYCLILGGLLAAVVFAATGGISLTWGMLGGTLAWATAIFVAQIAYEGVRAGRKLHLTDMVGDEKRARYTAISNSLIGAALLAGGGFGALADWIGTAWVLLVFACICVAGACVAVSLDEVQQD